MRQGTTPTHEFQIPFSANEIRQVMIVYTQGDKEILCKNTEDVTLGEKKVSVTLTQEETFLFDHKQNVRIQVRVLTHVGDALSSNIITVDVEECLNDEVLQ